MSEDDSLYKSQIPQLISNSNMIDSHHEEVNKFFKSYLKEKFTAKDYKLLKGVFWDEDLKNNELDLINNEEEKDGIDANHSDPLNYEMQMDYSMQNY